MGKRGPAPKGPFTQSTVFSCRLQPDTRARLDAARAKSGHSLGQELEFWLRRAFKEEDRAIDAYGTRQNCAVCKLIGQTIQAAGVVRRKDPKTIEIDPTLWLRDPTVFDAAVSGILHLLAGFRPSGTDPTNAGLH